MNQYLCIDLKSFFASVECVERGLDPMTARLVVADPDRGSGTICLAVSPALKALGVKNRCRVYEIPAGIDYIMATPRMQKYIDYSARIYGVYLRYISKDDMHVYSIDEVFIDATQYMRLYGMTARSLAVFLMNEVVRLVGVRATCGIGTNLYLAKIALDITAKKSPDFIGELDEESFRATLWDHEPLTDFWRIGPGTARHLGHMGIFTMRDIARTKESWMYREFGIDAELMIDHAWGRETATIADIKACRPKTESMSRSQVLLRDYRADEARIVLREMVESLCLEITAAKVAAKSVTMYVMYSRTADVSPIGGTAKLVVPTDSMREIVPEVLRIYDRTVDMRYPVRKLGISANELSRKGADGTEMTMFDVEKREHDAKLQECMLGIREKWGKNALLKGMSYLEAGTQRMRNMQIGGHRK